MSFMIPPPPPYIRNGTEVRSVALFLDHFFKKQESSLIIEEDQMSLSWPPRRWHENCVTRNGADLIWLGCQVITGQYLDIVNTHHSLWSDWSWLMNNFLFSFLESLTKLRDWILPTNIQRAEKCCNANIWFCTKRRNTAAVLTYTAPAKVKAWEHKTFVFAAQLPLAGFHFETF